MSRPKRRADTHVRTGAGDLSGAPMSSDDSSRPGEPTDPPTLPDPNTLPPEPLPPVPIEGLTTARPELGQPLPAYPEPPEGDGASFVPPLVPRPPHPGFFFSVLWCLAFLLVTYGILLVTLIAAIPFEG